MGVFPFSWTDKITPPMIDCDKLCIHNVMPGATTKKKIYTEKNH